MARNIWDVSDILLQQRAGDIQGNMFANLGQQAGQAFQQYGEMKKQNNLFKAKSTSIESTIKAHPELWGGKEAVDQLLAQNPNETPMARYTRLSDDITNKITANKLSEMASTARAKNIEAEAIRAMSNPMFAAEQAVLGGAKFGSIPQAQNLDAFSRVNQYISAGGSDANLINAMANLQNTNIKANQPPKLSSEDKLVAAEVDAWKSANPDKQLTSDVTLAIERRVRGKSPNISLGTPSAGQAIKYDPATGSVVAFEIPGSAEIGEKQKGKADLTNTISGMMSNIGKLNDIGAMVNEDNDIFTNFGARVAASSIGQAVGGTAGTKAQSLRNKLNSSVPAVLSSIKKASGLSATQLNSNVELQFYMKQVGDDSMDLQSRLYALDQIDKMYGTGNALNTIFPDNPEFVSNIRGVASQKQPESNKEGFVEGMVYSDKNGRKAKFVNGNWIEIP